VLGSSDKIILDLQGGQGVVPYLPLPELRSRPAAPPSQPATGGNR